jgi:hypothetical protein
MTDKLMDKMADVMDEVYGDPDTFIAAYNESPQKVFQTFVRRMKVVPITLKADLRATYTCLCVERGPVRA